MVFHGLQRTAADLSVVPRRGLEPPRFYPLVPETSASTNSATWAGGNLRWCAGPRTITGSVRPVNAELAFAGSLSDPARLNCKEFL